MSYNMYISLTNPLSSIIYIPVFFIFHLVHKVCEIKFTFFLFFNLVYELSTKNSFDIVCDFCKFVMIIVCDN